MGYKTRSTRVARLYAPQDGEPISVRHRADQVATEEPLEIFLNADPYLTTMRTPGDDVELVHGLLHSEGLIVSKEDVVQVRHRRANEEVSPEQLLHQSYNTVEVFTAAVVDPSLPKPATLDPTPGARTTLMNSSCGMCGIQTVRNLKNHWRYDLGAQQTLWDPRLVLQMPELLQEHQAAFAKTGGLQGAAIVSAEGEVLVAREDVGRHNAVDKVIGWLVLQERLAQPDLALVVSGRASFELVHKAIAAGLNLLVAVSAPSSLAVQLAEEGGLTLCAFTRAPSMNVYSGPGRLGLD